MGSIGTLGTLGFNDALKGLDHLEDLMTVLDELNIDQNSSQANTLMDSRRVLISTEDAEVRLFEATAKPKLCRLYFFNDMFIIGQYKKKRRKKQKSAATFNTDKTMGTQDGMIMGELVGRRASGMEQSVNDEDNLDDLSLDAGSAPPKSPKAPRRQWARSKSNRSLSRSRKSSRNSGTLKSGQSQSQAETPSLKMRLWLDLDNVDLRKIKLGEENGIRCSCSLQETYEDPETGEISYSTEVRQIELFFQDADIRDNIYLRLANVVDQVLEAKIRSGSKFGEDSTMALSDAGTDGDGDAGSVQAETVGTIDLDDPKMQRLLTMRQQSMRTVNRSKSEMTDGSGTSKKRSYASAKETMRKARFNRNKKKSGNEENKFDDALSLNDIVDKYKLILAPDQSNLSAEFKVTFGQGKMGLALSSLKEADHGVFVGKLESGGMAEVGGVTLGDRVLKVNDVDVTKGMSWQDVIEVIGREKQTLGEDGKPKKLVMVFSRSQSVEENVTQKIKDQKKEQIKERIKKKMGVKREWTKRKGKSFGNKMGTLKDIKEKYSEKRIENEVQGQEADQLFEILMAQDMSKVEKKCAFILQEIYTTEKSYVSNLYVLIDTYMRALEKKKVEVPCRNLPGKGKFCEHKNVRSACSEMSSSRKHVMEKQDVKSVFGNVQLLVQINESLLGSLQSGMSKLVKKFENENFIFSVLDVVLIYAPVFSRIMPFFRIYSQYAYQYSNALETLVRLRDNDEFMRELAKIENKKNTESLNNLLMKPIARLCKYPLLFSNLSDAMQSFIGEKATEAKETGKGDVDKLDRCLSELLEAAQIVGEIAASVDVKVGTSQDLERLYEIYMELGGHKAVQQFMVPSRKFVDKYHVFVEDKNVKKGKLKPMVLYLFNDLVIFTQEKTNNFFGITTGSFMRGKGTMDRSSVVNETPTKSKSGSRVSAKRSGPKGKEKDRSNLKVKKQFKIESVNVKNKVVPKDGMYGFGFTETERATSLVKKTKKNPNPEELLETRMNRYDIWTEAEETRNEILNAISAQVKTYKKNKRERKRINAKLQPELKAKQRQWKSKARKLRQESIKKLSQSEKRKSQFIEMSPTDDIDENAAVNPIIGD